MVRHISSTDPDVHVRDGTVWMYCSQDQQMREVDKGDWYCFYHIGENELKPDNWNGERRIACIDKLFYNEEGTIRMVEALETHIQKTAK